jgi:hypothetical protein
MSALVISSHDVAASSPENVRFAPESGQTADHLGACASARTGCEQSQQKRLPLFDQLVGAGEQNERNGDTKRLGSNQVYNEIKTEALLTGRKFGFAQGDRTVNAKRATSHRLGISPSRGGERHKGGPFFLVLTAIGVVFGDIGTSPLYTLPVTLGATGHATPTASDVLGTLADLLGADGDSVAQIRRSRPVRRQRR